MITNPAQNQQDELQLEEFYKGPNERHSNAFFLAIIISLLLHGTIAAAIVQGFSG